MKLYIPAGSAQLPPNPQIPYLVLDKKGTAKRLAADGIIVDFEDILTSQQVQNISNVPNKLDINAQTLTQQQQQQVRQNMGFTTAVTSVSLRFGSSMLNYVSRHQINIAYGGFVFVNFSVWVMNSIINSGQELGVLPEGFRPVGEVVGSCIVMGTSSPLSSGASVAISGDGRILYRGNSIPSQTQSPAFVHTNTSFITY